MRGLADAQHLGPHQGIQIGAQVIDQQPRQAGSDVPQAVPAVQLGKNLLCEKDGGPAFKTDGQGIRLKQDVSIPKRDGADARHKGVIGFWLGCHVEPAFASMRHTNKQGQETETRLCTA